MAPLALDVTLTCSDRDDSNAAAFVRRLAVALQRRELARPVVHAGGATWRTLTRRETKVLLEADDAKSPSPIYGLLQRIPGFRAPPVTIDQASGFLEPEVPSARTLAALPALLGAMRAPHVAVFHGANALREPQRHQPSLVERLPLFLRLLLQFDAVACISDEAAAQLIGYWDWLGESAPRPMVTALPQHTQSESGWDRIADAILAVATHQRSQPARAGLNPRPATEV